MNYVSLVFRFAVLVICCFWFSDIAVASPLQSDSLAGSVSLTLVVEKDAYVEGEDIRMVKEFEMR